MKMLGHFILINLMILHTINCLRNTSVEFVWRKYLVFEKNWLSYMEFGLNYCTHLFTKQSYLIFYEKLNNCIHKNALRLTNCQYTDKIRYTLGLSNETYIIDKYNIIAYSSITITLTQMTFAALQPLRQECLNVYYNDTAYYAYFINSKKLAGVVDKFRYLFEAMNLFGLQVIFKIFQLSHMCLPLDEGTRTNLHKDTEYVMIHGKKINTLFFCLKRPQWSIYTANAMVLDYFVCTICKSQQSRIVFNYQIIDANIIETYQDDYAEIYYSEMKASAETTGADPGFG